MATSIGIFDLPEEIQNEICSHCSQCDLICLSLVCYRFRELAAAQLYRNFHIVFPDEDDPCFDSPIDGLAGGLDTFVTSEYNYAKHLRDLSLDTLSAGDKAEVAYKPYLASVSCGKFMNTLLLLTLRRAKALDTFRWNIRVELSRPVYKALHDIRSLRSLHIRLQAGPSLYEIPPPLPYVTAPYHVNPTTSSALPWSTPDGPVAGTLFGPPPPFLAPPPSYNKPPPRSRPANKSSTCSEPPTISGFKNLENLSILDIDNLDIIAEIKVCVRNSASTLKKLKLSFSDALATQARKPCLDTVDPEESDPEDDFQVVPLPNAVNFEASGPAKVYRAQEERKAQEAVLGHVFEIEPYLAKTWNASKETPKKGKQELPDKVNSRENIADVIENVTKTNIQKASAMEELNTTIPQKVLDSVMEVVRNLDTETRTLDRHTLLDIIATATREGLDPENRIQITAGSSSQGVITQATSVDSWDDRIVTPATDDKHSSASGYSTHKYEMSNIASKDEMKPEDIDIASPEEQLAIDSQEEQTNDESLAESSPAKTPVISTKGGGTPLLGDGSDDANAASKTAQRHNIDRLTLKLYYLKQQAGKVVLKRDPLTMSDEEADARLQEAHRRLDSINREMKSIMHEINMIEAEVEDAAMQSTRCLRGDEIDEISCRVNEYARGTRGIGLQSLSLHLIPIKASVLGRAIDLHVLKRITLLNVGSQAPFWVLMSKENRVKPLQLRKIFTDNVSLQFLHFVSELDCLHELFLLERMPKYKPESLVPKSKTTIEQIRKFVLRKHMPNLKRLMIKNKADGLWDVDSKTTQLICRRGKVLEELAVTMGMDAVHVFIQNITGLINLRALQLISFRHEDTCLSVMRETRRFIVDAVSHHPQLKLKYLCIVDDERVTRIIRKPRTSRKTKKDKGKGKGASQTGLNYSWGTSHGPFPVVESSWDTESDSEEDEDEDELPGMELELNENVPYYDIWGVRIFKKEMVAGRL
ncbi:hypothetical protein F4775DRAFT_547619 [Biscogniauxia sp. FL1348]|nr:hypothetical protein F4775DRAFT_547619 [Biscogniauxia sp. FL1348]